MRIGITGQNGFIGRHLYNTLSLDENIELVPFRKDYFQDQNQLADFVSKCDTIIHLAGANRHPDPDELYNINVSLSKNLVTALEKAEVNPHIIFSSSIQESKDNHYGRSKNKAGTILNQWAEKNDAIFTGLIIPNVFGPFCKPFYNSVVATFCQQITNNEVPKIINDSDLKLIYVNHLVEEIKNIVNLKSPGKIHIDHQYELKVSKLLDTLKKFHLLYMEKGNIPSLVEEFDLVLFNTFRCYIPHSFYPKNYQKHEDERGCFVEIIRANSQGQSSFSTTKPGITRGNHFHTRKVERFAVIKGKALIQLRKVDDDKLIEYILDGDNPAFVDMPIWHTHNISNIGEDELITLFWINEPYDPKDPDTYYVKV